MHLSLLVMAVAIAVCTRIFWSCRKDASTWANRWQQSISAFLLAPLLLITTAIAVLCMGTQGQMLGIPVGWIGYLLALGFLGLGGVNLLRLGWQGWRSLSQVSSYPLLELGIGTGYRLETPALFAAQVGFWQPKLVVSQGLLDRLTPEQINAVLTHEQAHVHYRDTFWFFWLGWLRQFTLWLPSTGALWQELLLIRELRADQWAAQLVDPLVLAESLLLVVQDAPVISQDFCAAFGEAAPVSRLEERIEALLTAPESFSQAKWMTLVPLLVALVPLLTLLIHR